MMNTQTQSDGGVITAQNDPPINMGTNEVKVAQEFSEYKKFQSHLQAVISTFNLLGAGQIQSIEDLKKIMTEGGTEFLEDVLEKLAGKDLKIGALKIQKSKLPDLLLNGEKDSFYSAILEAKKIPSSDQLLRDDFFKVENDQVILDEVALQKYLNVKWTWLISNENEKEIYREWNLFAAAAERFEKFSQSHTSVPSLTGNIPITQWLEVVNEPGKVKFIPRLPLSPPW